MSEKILISNHSGLLTTETTNAVHTVRLQFLPGQPFVGFQIFCAGFGNDIGREHGAGRGFVPSERFEVVADELFVEARLAAARLILVGGPETRGIRRHYFVNQNQFAVAQTKFELGVGDDDATLASVITSGLVNLQAQIPRLGRQFGANDFLRLLERNVFVMSGLGFGGRREDGFGQFGGFGQASRELDAADHLRLLIFLPAGTG